MGNPFILEKISIDPPREKIYQRLGYKKSTTEISAQQRTQTDRLIHEASDLISLNGMFLRLDIHLNDGEKILLANHLNFTSKKLAAFLGDCREAVLMGATAGQAIMDAIKDKTGRNDLSAAVVYDAAASEMVDGALDWMMGYINRILRREGKILLPRRFSAGYADFLLENQKTIYDSLHMKNFGVKISRTFILIPEKSVTAIGGIRG